MDERRIIGQTQHDILLYITWRIEKAEGIRAIARGTNALVKSDQEMVERMSPISDALYAYCKHRVRVIRTARSARRWQAE